MLENPKLKISIGNIIGAKKFKLDKFRPRIVYHRLDNVVRRPDESCATRICIELGYVGHCPDAWTIVIRFIQFKQTYKSIKRC